jgi:hypothetical protein
MASRFGHGFVINLMHLTRHMALPPEKAFYGAADHLDGLVLPPQFRDTEVEKLLTLLRKKVIWHPPGPLDKEEHADIVLLLNRLAVAVDRVLGIPDADAGEFQ